MICLVVYIRVFWGTSQPKPTTPPPPKKTQKRSTLKTLLIFQEMELSSSNIKKILIFPKIEPCTSQPKPKKAPKIVHPEKNSLYFRNWIFLALILKKILIFSQKESFPYISENGTLHFSVQARKIKNNPSGEKFLYFRKRKPRKKFLYFLYFRKRNF